MGSSRIALVQCELFLDENKIAAHACRGYARKTKKSAKRTYILFNISTKIQLTDSDVGRDQAYVKGIKELIPNTTSQIAGYQQEIDFVQRNGLSWKTGRIAGDSEESKLIFLLPKNGEPFKHLSDQRAKTWIRDANIPPGRLCWRIMYPWRICPKISEQERRKPRNKRDIAEITDKVEQVKSEYIERLEELSSRIVYSSNIRSTRINSALPLWTDGLKSINNAFALWQKLMMCCTTRKVVGEVIRECRDWWVRNNLYLEEEARQAFCHTIPPLPTAKQLYEADPVRRRS